MSCKPPAEELPLEAVSARAKGGVSPEQEASSSPGRPGCGRISRRCAPSRINWAGASRSSCG